MKFTRKANANWKGSGKEGKGTLTTQSAILNETQYSYKSRYENGIGTNPEELVAAALSGCFTMKLAFLLGEAGFTPGNLDTVAKVTYEGDGIAYINLELNGQVEGISDQKFQEVALEAKETCPISKIIKVSITLTANLAK